MSKEKQSKEDQERSEECLPRDQAERLFTHAIHEDGIFNARMHSFLLIQTVMLTALGLHRNAPGSSAVIVRAIAVAALVLSLMWGYVQARQKLKLDVLVHRLEKFLPEFARTRKWTRPGRCCPYATQLLAYAIPASFVILWLVIAGSTFYR